MQPTTSLADMLRILLIGCALGLGACREGQPPSTVTPDDSEQTVSALRADDQERLQAQRKVVVELVANDADTLRKLETAAGKLGAIRALLDARTFKPDQTYELQCLGIVLGDAFVVELGMEWVIVEDKIGRAPAVRAPGTSILLFPSTMISKRIERGETVDVFDLFNRVAARVDELKKEGR